MMTNEEVGELLAFLGREKEFEKDLPSFDVPDRF
jgi:hypothetical protein